MNENMSVSEHLERLVSQNKIAIVFPKTTNNIGMYHVLFGNTTLGVIIVAIFSYTASFVITALGVWQLGWIALIFLPLHWFVRYLALLFYQAKLQVALSKYDNVDILDEIYESGKVGIRISKVHEKSIENMGLPTLVTNEQWNWRDYIEAIKGL